MSNSTDTTGCISHKRNKRFFVMYEDYLEIASVSKHQYKLAAFWRVLETKTNDRITYNQGLIEEAKKKGEPEPETTLWIEVPYSEYVNRALGIYKSSSFQVAAAESERLGFSASRVLQRKINPQDPQSPKEDYKEYLYLTDRMQSVLDGGEYPTPIEINSTLLKGIEERQKRKAIDKNTPPIEINSHSDETPVDFNGTPLLKSTSNKYISNNSLKNIGNIESLLSDDNPLTPEEKFAKLKALLQEVQSTLPHQSNVQNAIPLSTDPAKGGASPTPAGRNSTVPLGGNSPTQEPTFPKSSASPENAEPTFLDNASSEPPNRANLPLAESQGINTAPTQDKALLGELEAQKPLSSVPAHDESNRQVTGQASDTSHIATSTTNNSLPVNDATKPPQSEPVQPAPQKPRGGRGKSVATKEEKPQLSDEEKAKEAQYAERRRFWQNKINERRGGPLRTRGLCINETECLNTLVREFDDIDIGKIDRYLATEHWKYKKNPAEIGGKALLDESRPTLQLLKTKGGQLSSSSSQQTPTPIKASMTHDEANKLMQDAIEQAKQYNIVIVAQAVSSKNNPDAWGVRVKWDDGSENGFPFPPIKVREQWDSTLTEIRKIIKEEAKQAARSAVRMQEAK